MLSGKAAIVGIGANDFSKNSGRSELRLAAPRRCWMRSTMRDSRQRMWTA